MPRSTAEFTPRRMRRAQSCDSTVLVVDNRPGRATVDFAGHVRPAPAGLVTFDSGRGRADGSLRADLGPRCVPGLAR